MKHEAQSAELHLSARHALARLAARYGKLGITSAADAIGRALDELHDAEQCAALHRAWIETHTMPSGELGSRADAARASRGAR